jgi:hypothetical protein
MRACVIARLGDSNHSPRRIIINPSIFANHPACRVAVSRFLLRKKRLTPPAAVVPWLLIFNCLKEPKSGDFAMIRSRSTQAANASQWLDPLQFGTVFEIPHRDY